MMRSQQMNVSDATGSSPHTIDATLQNLVHCVVVNFANQWFLSITAPSIVMKSNGLSLRGLTLAKGLLAVEPLQVDFELVLRRPIETARLIRTVHKNAPRTKRSAHFRVPLSAWNGSFYTLVPWVHWSPRPRLLFFGAH